MDDVTGSSSIPSQDSKPVIVRVKRKACQSAVEAFWLEIKEKPLKRTLLNFEKLSVSESSEKFERLNSKKVLVQHVETLNTAEVTADILHSFVSEAVDGYGSKSKSEGRRRSFKVESKQDQLLVKAKQKQEVSSKNARFEQIWRRRKVKKEATGEATLHDVCHVYDIVRVDAEETIIETSTEQEDRELEDHRIMSSYLPLLREFIPSAAAEIESDIHEYVSKVSKPADYVYDLYAVKYDEDMMEEDASNPFPLVQVDEDDDFYDGPDASDYESDDSNAEDNPLNDYPDELASEDDDEDDKSGSSNDESEENEKESKSSKSSEAESFQRQEGLEIDDDYIYGDGDGDGDGDDAYYCCDDGDGDNDDDWRWSYR